MVPDRQYSPGTRLALESRKALHLGVLSGLNIPSEILHQTRQCDRRALCDISEGLGDYDKCYARCQL